MIFSSRRFFQKTNARIRLYYYETSGRLVFVRFFGRKWRHQKDISKLTDLDRYWNWNLVSIPDTKTWFRSCTIQYRTWKMGVTSKLCSCFFEYETPKVITVKNVPMGILRLLLQTIIISFIAIFQLWYSRGYQTFLDVEASVTTKVKGFSM